MKKGTLVLVRAQSAGVHFGTLEAYSGQEVHLKNARRLWSWAGALSLSEVSAKGVEIKNSNTKISVPVEEILLTTAIEIIPISENSNLAELCHN
jgi:hypothetical protein